MASIPGLHQIPDHAQRNPIIRLLSQIPGPFFNRDASSLWARFHLQTHHGLGHFEEGVLSAGIGLMPPVPVWREDWVINSGLAPLADQYVRCLYVQQSLFRR